MFMMMMMMMTFPSSNAEQSLPPLLCCQAVYRKSNLFCSWKSNWRAGNWDAIYGSKLWSSVE